MNINLNFNKIFGSKVLKITLGVIGALIVALLVFEVGFEVGSRKAGFSCHWGENYRRNFGGQTQGFLKEFKNEDLVGAHGVFGKIIKIDGQEIVIQDRGNVEKIVIVKDDTVIQRFRGTVNLTDLKVDDQVVIIGEPNTDGKIEARFIRILPTPLTVNMPTPPTRRLAPHLFY